MRIWASQLVLAALLALAPPARASVAVALTIADLTRAADLVVLGMVGSTRAVWSQDHRTILTRVSVQPEAAWKGSVPGGGIIVLLPGGQLDGLVQEVSGIPEAAAGDRVVLFLRRRGGSFRLVGMAQGLFRIPSAPAGPAPQAIRSFEGLKLVPGDRGRPLAPEELSLPLEALHARVAEAMPAEPVR